MPFPPKNVVFISLFILGTTAFFRPKFLLHFPLKLKTAEHIYIPLYSGDHCFYCELSSSYSTSF